MIIIIYTYSKKNLQLNISYEFSWLDGVMYVVHINEKNTHTHIIVK